jgi:hypothetical protein
LFGQLLGIKLIGPRSEFEKFEPIIVVLSVSTLAGKNLVQDSVLLSLPFPGFFRSESFRHLSFHLIEIKLV